MATAGRVTGARILERATIQSGGYDATFIAVAGGSRLTGSAASWADADTGACKAWGHVILG